MAKAALCYVAQEVDGVTIFTDDIVKQLAGSRCAASLAGIGSAAVGQLWLFIVAPLLGATIAAGIYSVIRAVDPVIQIPASQAHAALPGQQEAKLDLARDTSEKSVPAS